MDFKLVLEKLLNAFNKEDVRYALMGGFALGLWGIHRATIDIDLLIDRDDLGKVRGIMAELGYTCMHQTENVSQYVSDFSVFGEIDFLHAFRKASIGMLRRAEEKRIFGGSLIIKVLRPEDLVGLKVQAMSNDKSRWAGDLADIERIMALYKTELDWPIIEEYFTLFGLGEMALELRGRYCAPE